MAAYMTVWRPSRVLAPVFRPMSLLEKMEALVEKTWEDWPDRNVSFALDVYEDKGEVVVKAELPGIEKEGVDIKLDGKKLGITAEKKVEEVTEGENAYFSQKSFSRQYRQVELPSAVKPTKTSTSFGNGLLEIRLPKGKKVAKTQHQIKVQ